MSNSIMLAPLQQVHIKNEETIFYFPPNIYMRKMTPDLRRALLESPPQEIPTELTAKWHFTEFVSLYIEDPSSPMCHLSSPMFPISGYLESKRQDRHSKRSRKLGRHSTPVTRPLLAAGAIVCPRYSATQIRQIFQSFCLTSRTAPCMMGFDVHPPTLKSSNPT